MLLNAIHRDGRRIPPQDSSQPFTTPAPFLQKVAGEDVGIYKILKNRKIHSVYDLSCHLAHLKAHIHFLRNLNLILRMLLWWIWVGGGIYAFSMYQTEYRERADHFQISLCSIGKNKSSKEIITPAIKQPIVMETLERNIFVSQSNALNAKTAEVSGPDMTEFKATYKIVGIAVDAQPEVIVENTKLQETIFASVGENIGGAQIIQILEDRVICRMEGAELELLP